MMGGGARGRTSGTLPPHESGEQTARGVGAPATAERGQRGARRAAGAEEARAPAADGSSDARKKSTRITGHPLDAHEARGAEGALGEARLLRAAGAKVRMKGHSSKPTSRHSSSSPRAQSWPTAAIS